MRPTACSAKSVHLDQLPDRAPTRITADSRYALFVNGQEVSRGPIRSQPRRMHYDLFDLAPYLRNGENVLAAYVKYYGRPKSYWMPAAPNLTLGKTGILVFEADLGGQGWLVSDTSWKARKCDAWLVDWREIEFDDTGWSCTPTRDMIFYTLGVTPVEPGYTKARIAPRLGRLEWAKGSVPTPYGLISVEANADQVVVDSPVPVIVVLKGQPARDLPKGKQVIAIQGDQS